MRVPVFGRLEKRLSNAFVTVGRNLLGLYFIAPGVGKTVGFQASSEYLAGLLTMTGLGAGHWIRDRQQPAGAPGRPSRSTGTVSHP